MSTTHLNKDPLGKIDINSCQLQNGFMWVGRTIKNMINKKSKNCFLDSFWDYLIYIKKNGDRNKRKITKDKQI